MSLDINNFYETKCNRDKLNQKQIEIINVLIDSNQEHLFNNWIINKNENEKQKFLNQAIHLDKICIEGLKRYIERSKDLLQKSANNINPFDGWAPSVANGTNIKFNSPEFHKAESESLTMLNKIAFVLVAGGLGERLGYSGIKIGMPCELTTGKCFLEYFIKNILTFQDHARNQSLVNTNDLCKIPLVIMTSDDTHEETLKLLESNHYFGMVQSQITLLKQNKVPCLSDIQSHISLKDNFTIKTKPHGHGDIHSLLLSSGKLKTWIDNKINWIVLFQDTNILAFRGIPSLLGISKLKNLDANILTVPRKPNEEMGSIVKLSKGDKTITCNIEYNQLNSLLSSTNYKNEMSEDERKPNNNNNNKFSKFPGNTNIIVLNLSTYYSILNKTGGLVPEFVNPKYLNSNKDKFIKPTRLECMMQDYLKFLDQNEKINYTSLERWLCYSAVKNNLKDALIKYKKTGYAECASSAEFSLYSANKRILEAANCKFGINPNETVHFGELPLENTPYIILEPSFGCTIKEIFQKFSNKSNVYISHRSTIILDGENIKIINLRLDGALRVVVKKDKSFILSDMEIKNNGWIMVASNENDEEIYKIRGYKLSKNEELCNQLTIYNTNMYLWN